MRVSVLASMIDYVIDRKDGLSEKDGGLSLMMRYRNGAVSDWGMTTNRLTTTAIRTPLHIHKMNIFQLAHNALLRLRMTRLTTFATKQMCTLKDAKTITFGCVSTKLATAAFEERTAQYGLRHRSRHRRSQQQDLDKVLNFQYLHISTLSGQAAK